jgi:ATP-dependent helicase/nuclease subunit A
VRDVQAFFERIQQIERTGQFSPELLATEVQKLYAAPDAKANDSLQFMTIHKSKGLEFDTVILPGLDCRTGRQDQPLLLWEEVSREEAHDPSGVDLVVAPLIPKDAKNSKVTAYDYLKMLEKERANFEDARVLYVAATRVERCLHLLGAAKVNKDGITTAPKNTFLEMLWPVVHHAFNTEQAIKPNPNLQTKLQTSIEQFIPQLVRVSHAQLAEILTTRTPQQAPSSIENLKLAEDKDTLSADIGTLAHFYMELIANSGVGKWEYERVKLLKPAMQRWFKQKGYDAIKCDQSAEAVINLLQTTLSSEDGEWVLKTRSTAENELSIESADNQSVIKKVIDRTYIEDGTRWIIDYKSVALERNTSDSALKAIAMQYREQLDGYEQLFTQENLPIQKAIFFLSLGRLSLL